MTTDSDLGDTVVPEAEEIPKQERIFADITKTDADPDIRLRAVERVNHQMLLTVLVLDAGDKKVREAAISRMTDSDHLFLVANKSDDINLRLDAIERMDDDSILQYVVAEVDDPRVRLAAAERLRLLSEAKQKKAERVVTKQDTDSLLLLCAEVGDVEGIRKAIANGASVDTEDEYGDTPLLHAVRSGVSVHAVQALVDLGANVNRKTPSGVTPLMIATAQGKAGICQVLMKAGADRNKKVLTYKGDGTEHRRSKQSTRTRDSSDEKPGVLRWLGKRLKR